MANVIGKKIDDFAQNYQAQLRSEEGKSARKMTKYDVAQYMVKQGVLSKAEFENWVKTDEGKNQLQLTNQQKDALRKGNVFGYANAGQESYLDSVSEFSLGNVLGFEKTNNGKVKAKPVVKKSFSVEKQVKKDKFRAHVNSLPETSESYTDLMKDIKKNDENKKLAEMTEFERKKYIAGKFLDAKDKNDKGAMFSALEEFFSYQCQVLDKKFGITDAKDFVKNTVGLNALVDYIDKAVDDNKSSLSSLEIMWEITKGVGDAIDGLIGTQGLTMAGVLGGASKLASMSKTLGPVVGGAIQAYFGLEGAKLVAEGTADIVNADTKEEVREGGAKVGMGGVMVAGAAVSVMKGKGANKQAETKAAENAPKTSAEGQAPVAENAAGVKSNTQNTAAMKGKVVAEQTVQNANAKANTRNEKVKPTKIKTIKEIKTEQTLAKAGITNEVMFNIRKECQGNYTGLADATFNMIEYLENRITRGEKLTPKLINKAIQDCDGIYAQPGYGSAFQEAQKGLLAKYWNRGQELVNMYTK